MPSQEEYDKLRADAHAEINKLKAERDMWHARAFAMFWRLPDDTLCGDLRTDTERALTMLRS